MMFQLWYGSVNQFRPQVAKAIYRSLSPKVGILDFSAGWGGRALGAMVLGIPYIGIDTNHDLLPCYNALQHYEPASPIQMVFQPAETVDFSSFTYDCVFTSPPYWTQEQYQHMPMYPTLQDFLQTFLVPVILCAWKHLLSPGTLALNLPVWLYDRLAPLLSSLPPLHARLLMPYTTRFVKGQGTSHEWVYVWRKESS
jgi:tRNA G10  N-methylase Trm11